MNKKIALILLIGAVVGLFIAFDLQRFLSLQALTENRQLLHDWYQQNPMVMLLGFFAVYVIATAFSLPGAAVLTLAAGALFGVFTGVILVSFASTIGATGAFLFARFLLRDTVEKRFGNQLQAINKGLQEEGAFYLFTLRLVPLFPFFAINLMMGITQIKTRTFFWVSQLGMLAGTIVYVNAGTQLSKIQSLADILSPPLIASFVVLGVFPLVAKKIVNFIQKRRVADAQ